MKESLISTRLSKNLLASSIQEKLAHRIDKIVNPSTPYKALKFLSLDLPKVDNNASIRPETDAQRENPIIHFGTWIKSLDKSEYINRNKSPFQITDFPSPDIQDQEFKKGRTNNTRPATY